MFNRIKEALKRIRELYKNPKTHDIVSLGCWLLFIVVVIIFLRITTSNSNDTKDENNYRYNINSYEFTYNYDNYNISGLYYNDKMIFYFDNNKYYYNNFTYLIQGDKLFKQDNFDLKALKINYEFIYKLIKDLPSTKDNDYDIYSVPLDSFIGLYDEDVDIDINSARNYNVIIKIKMKDDKFSSVNIDMSNYFVYKGINITYPVIIYFYNINNISNFTKEYEQMLGVK